MMRRRRQHAIERALPTRRRLPGKAAHQVARHIKASFLHRRDGGERPIGIVNAADGGKFGVIERLHAQRNACDTNLGKRSSKLGGQRLGLASQVNSTGAHHARIRRASSTRRSPASDGVPPPT